MVWIEAKARVSLPVRATRDAIRALILDVPKSGPFFPGVNRIEDLGSGRYRWTLVERRTLGSRFTGLYVAEYREEGPEAGRQPLRLAGQIHDAATGLRIPAGVLA